MTIDKARALFEKKFPVPKEFVYWDDDHYSGKTSNQFDSG